MKRKQLKFLAASIAIVLALGYIGFQGFTQSMSYFQTVSQLYASKEAAYDRRLNVNGEVAAGSIVREGRNVKFVITEGNNTLPVHYVGTDPLPDTFRDYAQAVVHGKYRHDGVFEANQVEAKCASKYERESAAGMKTAKAAGGE